jgi:hemolysin III
VASERIHRAYDRSEKLADHIVHAAYTPFMVQLQGTLASVVVLIGVWSTALTGVLLKLLLPGRLDRMSIIVYVILGWSGAVDL